MLFTTPVLRHHIRGFIVVKVAARMMCQHRDIRCLHRITTNITRGKVLFVGA